MAIKITPLNMATPIEIQSDLQFGWNFHLDLSEKEYEKSRSGCITCGNKLWPCLFSILNGLQYRVDQSVYDETTDKLHSDMMLIIG